MGIHRGEHSLEIPAPPGACFEAITDYESFPEWQRAVKRVEVVSRHADGLAEIVEVRIDAMVREVTYRLRYGYEPPHRVYWDYVEGDVEHVDGEFLFEPVDAGTLATYRLGLDPGVPMPGFMLRRLSDQLLRRSVADLRDEVARRAG